ncbi:MAG: carbohydrate ABC transporter permease [Candidatus Caldatribacterium sp.]|nr:carbohydrate ABC transporter permease [Candidatus Caldatribacterium sp.]
MRSSRAYTVCRYWILVVLSVSTVFPFFWMFSSSLKPLREVYTWPPTLIPRELHLSNFREAFERSNFIRALINSSLYTGGCIALYVPISLLAAFGFAKYRFKGDSLLFMLVLAAVMIPIEAVIVPLFGLLLRMRWVGTLQGLVIPRVVEPFGIFLLRQHFKTIPDDLLDAARIDGCSELGILWRVMLPLSLPPLAVIVVFMFIWRWNELLWPLVIGGNAIRTIQPAIALFKYERFVEWNLLMALCAIAVIPVLVLFFTLQRYFVEGVVKSGLKF